MNYYTRCCFLIFVCCCSTVLASSNSYWQCRMRDATSIDWVSQSAYKKMALNHSFAACKKESNAPASCTIAAAHCEFFIEGVSTSPSWQCTALDRTAAVWPGATYAHRDDAALGARAYCRQRSIVPGTCYVNFVTCTNKNEWK